MIESIKYSQDKRAHIPSKEEAGMEPTSKTEASYVKNPVTHRGQDPELYWLDKYGNDDRDELLKVDIRSLYRHEHISPELLIQNLYKLKEQPNPQLDLFSMFGNTLQMDELDKVADYYQYSDNWKNRLIQGDSLLVMASLLEREGMAGKVQTIYFDPPYGIKYGSNWQLKLNNRDVKDGSDEHLTGEPEMIKAFRDTWEKGIHSYLSYLRDRLLVAKELLSNSGSCFLQISDDNVHLVRSIMDEVFGSENFVSMISFQKAAGGLRAANRVGSVLDYIIWYCKDIDNIKYRPLYEAKGDAVSSGYVMLEEKNGNRRGMTQDEKSGLIPLPQGSRPFMTVLMTKPGPGSKFDVEYNGRIYTSGKRWWGTTKEGIQNVIKANRISATENSIRFISYFDDFPYRAFSNLWSGLGGASDPLYVVQTSTEVIQRCLLMTTDPGDLVLDPTCGSGTTAHVAEKWGRRWITIDTSRIALNIAKTRLMTATYPFYRLHDTENKDIRQGFIYKKVSHITLKNIANDDPADEETLYDQPQPDNKKLRVAGPFTVETLQNFEPASPQELDSGSITPQEIEDTTAFEQRIFEHLKSAGIKNGIRNENAVFKRVERRGSALLHAEGFYNDAEGKERKAYIHIGPKFGTVSKQAVNDSVKECRAAGDADWLIILGFSFESDISNQNVTTSVGTFEVTKVRMHDDLLQEGLTKKVKTAASFVTIGEPDINLHRQGNEVTVEICGLDIYDPMKDEVKPRNIADIAYWMVDDDYDGSNFIVKQVFFCGGNKNEFDKFNKGLNDLTKQGTKKKAEKTLKIELDDDAWDRLYGHTSHPIPLKQGKKIAVRVISQFGEESTKVLLL
ncbi:site-specific DNA-methyltransferase [Tellurirhabdus rosea]|uniref:site-specific DNA-methyltransferase n=1 Tax=Tellurirhabdus rosea TaxID=2674997 RepID=UPI002258CCF6|nr:site-specific DNA-methyltransferase [Tellurirhabdus rosea]